MQNTLLRTAIMADGRRQAIIGALANMTESTLSRIVTGDRDPKLSEMIALAEVLGMPVHELFPGLNSAPTATTSTAVGHYKSTPHAS